MLHATDRVAATHKISGAGGERIEKGMRGTVLKHYGSAKPKYRVEFAYKHFPLKTTVIDNLTDADIKKVDVDGSTGAVVLRHSV